ncbi:GvpL/GvpF family gas vesicle protein [Endozoicomonas sp. SM1973]|uniref:GvpL/GvpF family gas vesicle protein n=1 Tax=Spartinivicinus marinus TaxID=2994442 RepID=A0A853HW83_9GAMM|nr:GvpL/GvpF family gas vesicle protein [Spartinivicinus marinus]MCX4028904.1 GvpL/GvpF family gas vesicle protein [Spartinivicinus marinus]NYZ65513.1 GvpL/GvpF family gas vesicle protein [Spartinivicinus marinus]
MAEEAADLTLLTDEAIYLYGFILPHALPVPIKVLGISEAPVIIYYQQQLAAVISKVSIDVFTGSAAEQRLQDPEWLTQQAYQHEQVVEQVWQHVPIYPVRFATLFSSTRQLAEQMACQQHSIKQCLTKFALCNEWAVKGFLDRQQAQTALWEITCQQQQSTLSHSAGIRHLQEQRLRRELGKQVNQWLNGTCQTFTSELSALAREWCQRKVMTKQAELPDGSQVETILNLAFLVDTLQQDNFLQKIAENNSRWQEYGLQFSCTRWPPYSFCRTTFTSESLNVAS